MADEVKSNLEPIEEGDLNLKAKFLGGAEKKKEAASEKPKEKTQGNQQMEKSNLPNENYAEGSIDKKPAQGKDVPAEPLVIKKESSEAKIEEIYSSDLPLKLETKPKLRPIELKEPAANPVTENKELPKAKIEEMHSLETQAVSGGNEKASENRAEGESAYNKILSKIHSKESVPAALTVPDDAEQANTGMDAESKIQNLVKLAETKGIPHAVKVARHMEDNYSLDEFHDRLLGEELHAALVKKGMIKEI